MLRVIGNSRRLDGVVSVIAAGASGAVIAIALPELMQLRSEASTIRELINAIQLTHGPPRVGYGLDLTVAGGCLGGIGALVGLVFPWLSAPSIATPRGG
jgi:hypothetical protein